MPIYLSGRDNDITLETPGQECFTLTRLSVPTTEKVCGNSDR